jgi:hypothetical protein
MNDFIDQYEDDLVEAGERRTKRGRREKANQEREALIDYLENDGTFWERLWLPMIRFVHRRCS